MEKEYTGVFKYVDKEGTETSLYPDTKTDDTLSVSGKAADAKAVGDKIAALRTDVIGTLDAGETSLTLSDPAIKADSTVDVYASIYGVSPTDVVWSEGEVVLTFDAQSTAMNVKVRVS